MGTHDRNEGGNISIIDAVETLSNIADLDFEHELGITESHDLMIQDQKVTYKTVHWLSQHEAGDTLHLIRDTFRVVLNYLKNFYKKEYSYVTDQRTVEGIKTIMVLVGEAAKKLDKYTSIFHLAHATSITESKEYKQLQEFYFSRIARSIDEGVLGKWILALSKRAMLKRKPPPISLVSSKLAPAKHVFVDLDSVKKDTEYELFYLRKEDGTRFFSPRLIRNIKLVCDFGSYFGEAKGLDPLIDVKLWQDRVFQGAAKSLLSSIGPALDRFYREALIYKQNELVETLNKAIMALMLSANPAVLKKNDPKKCCGDYFRDFQKFLKNAMQTRDYQKLIAYPPKKTSKLAHCLLDTVHALSFAFYGLMQGLKEMSPFIQRLVEEANEEQSAEHRIAAEKSQTLWSRLGSDYAAMIKLMKRHPNGPLSKVLDALEEGVYHYYDPATQENIPSKLYAIHGHENRIESLHIPCPTYQEFIHKATVNEEFKGFLRAFGNPLISKSKHLYFNLQDRTSWREYSRCNCMEDLNRQKDISNYITVVTLNHDAEFYHQLAPYHEDHQTEVFIGHLKEHLQDESSGFFFPQEVKKALFPDFIDNLVLSVHRIFFGGKNVLQRERRLDFIQIVYLFLELKIIEIVKPDTFSMSCKDGLDLGLTTNVLLYAFLALLNEENISPNDLNIINTMLYGPVLLARERNLFGERFNRMLSALKVIEETRKEHGAVNFRKIILEAFGRGFKSALLEGRSLP